jgi:hypothetical protein
MQKNVVIQTSEGRQQGYTSSLKTNKPNLLQGRQTTETPHAQGPWKIVWAWRGHPLGAIHVSSRFFQHFSIFPWNRKFLFLKKATMFTINVQW